MLGRLLIRSMRDMHKLGQYDDSLLEDDFSKYCDAGNCSRIIASERKLFVDD